MGLISFMRKFPSEEKCKAHFIETRMEQGVICKKCGCEKQYWLKTIEQFKCSSCGFRTTLKSGTALHGTHLPFQYWYIAFELMSDSKKPISALELQRMVEHKYYEPIWFLMHRIRKSMGKRDEKYKVEGRIEMDDAFIKATKQDSKKPITPTKKKRGRGTEKKPFVLFVESQKVSGAKQSKYKSDKKVSFIKMVSVDYLNSQTIISNIQKSVNTLKTHIVSDQATYYSGVKNCVQKHTTFNLSQNPSALDEEFDWIHTVISNLKRNILGIHHSIGEKYLQNYLNEFVYRFNRRNFDNVFDTILRTATTTSNR